MNKIKILKKKTKKKESIKEKYKESEVELYMNFKKTGICK